MATPPDLWSTFDAVAGTVADRVAIAHGERTTSFAELWRLGCAADSRLRRMGLEPGSRVVIRAAPSVETAAAILGAWRAGGIVALLDPSEAPRRARVMARQIEADVVLTDEQASSADGDDAETEAVQQIVAGGRRDPLPARRVASTAPASIVFTSGSTGGPKGVVQSHGNLVRGCRTVAGVLGYRPEDSILCPVPWSFDYGFGQLLSTVVLGMTHVLPEPAGPFGIPLAVERHRPSVLAAVPWLMSYVAATGAPADAGGRCAVRLVTTSGGAVPRRVLERVVEALPRASISLNYGLTETYRTTSLRPELVFARPESVGTAVPGVDVVIVDERRNPVGEGVVGEVVHRGDFVCLGYWGDDAATRQAVGPDPLAGSSRATSAAALYTGDLGILEADGHLVLRGRRDRLLKSHGVRVSPEEIERAISEAGGIEEVAVGGVPCRLGGHELFAVVVPAGDADRSVDGVRRHCREVLPPWLRPARFIVAEALPRTSSGKVSYRSIDALGAAPDLEQGDPEHRPDGPRARFGSGPSE